MLLTGGCFISVRLEFFIRFAFSLVHCTQQAPSSAPNFNSKQNLFLCTLPPTLITSFYGYDIPGRSSYLIEVILLLSLRPHHFKLTHRRFKFPCRGGIVLIFIEKLLSIKSSELLALFFCYL